jgi:hypothetical protein
METIATNDYFSVKVDVSKNRVYASFHGFWAKMEIMEDYLTNLKKALAKINRNFTLVADLRDFQTLPQNLIPKQAEAMTLLAGSGIYKVAEILPKSVIASMQLKQTASKTNMPNQQFPSIPEGENWLDEEVKKL